ncbi:MAG TPA: hypothetical protein PLI51_05000 [bacterium]|nr:hypothetical protein [bacterium]HPQ66069.1 hypothetical protein [bacterium]
MGMDAILSVILPVLFLILTLEFSAKSRRRLKETMKPEDADSEDGVGAGELSFNDLFRSRRPPRPPFPAPGFRNESFEAFGRPEPEPPPRAKPVPRKAPAPAPVKPERAPAPTVSFPSEPEPPRRPDLVFSDDPLIQGVIFSEILKTPPGLSHRL